jgi:CheY-like chemotaxis protein
MKNILLVDDNAGILDTLAQTFSRTTRYCSILQARNGKEAADILRGVPVDLIVTDINMPVMDGYELIAHRNRFYPQVPVVAMTADASPEVMKQLNALGVAECLEKPFRFEAAACMVLKKLNEPSHAPHSQPAAPLMTV